VPQKKVYGKAFLIHCLGKKLVAYAPNYLIPNYLLIEICYHWGMKDRQRWLPFLLLNIFVSAAVTAAILFWYDRTQKGIDIPAAPVGMAAPSENLSAEASDSAAAVPDVEIDVEIVNVIGAEIFDAEMVSVRYSGEGELDLAGWYLEDEDKNVFVFPRLILFAEGAVRVHTMSGQDTVVDLYWGLRESVWESGEVASLMDPQGIERATYEVP